MIQHETLMWYFYPVLFNRKIQNHATQLISNSCVRKEIIFILICCFHSILLSPICRHFWVFPQSTSWQDPSRDNWILFDWYISQFQEIIILFLTIYILNLNAVTCWTYCHWENYFCGTISMKNVVWMGMAVVDPAGGEGAMAPWPCENKS